MHKSSVIIATITLCLSVACTQNQKYVNDSGMIWNTTYSITYDSSQSLTADILSTLTDVELSVSPFNDKSLVSALNRGETVKADKHLRCMIEQSQAVNRLSHGAFDPTLGPLIELWGFGRNHSIDDISDQQIADALTGVGILDCSVDEDGTVTLKSPDTKLNFSAIAKGYGVDCVAKMLAAHGCQNYMVEIGGEIVVAGQSPRGTLWNIQIDTPDIDNNGHTPLTYITLTDCAIATSGNYRNYHERADGSRFGHTISTLNGRPVETATLSATVIAPNCTLADALATSCMAMNPDDALAMIESLDNTACLLVLADNDAGTTADNCTPPYRIITSTTWPR